MLSRVLPKEIPTPIFLLVVGILFLLNVYKDIVIVDLRQQNVLVPEDSFHCRVPSAARNSAVPSSNDSVQTNTGTGSYADKQRTMITMQLNGSEADAVLNRFPAPYIKDSARNGEAAAINSLAESFAHKNMTNINDIKPNRGFVNFDWSKKGEVHDASATGNNLINPLIYAIADNRGNGSGLVRLHYIDTHPYDDKTSVLCKFRKDKSEFHERAYNTGVIKGREIIQGSRYYRISVHCHVPEEIKRVTDVRVSICKNDSDSCSNEVHVHVPRIPSRTKHYFGLCVRLAFGNFTDSKFDWLVEWFEFNRLLGVSEFNIYNSILRPLWTAEPKVQALFNHYEKLGVLQMHSIAVPFREHTETDHVRIGRLLTEASVTDCLLRHMHRYRHLLVLDLDEVIVPQNSFRYMSMFKELQDTTKRNINETSLVFQGRDYFLTYPEDTDQPPHLRSMRFMNFVNSTKRLKSMHNPRTCVGADSHMCRVQVEGVRGPGMHVPAAIATVHHYRTQCESAENPLYWSAERCANLTGLMQLDRRVLRYKPLLLHRVDRLTRSL